MIAILENVIRCSKLGLPVIKWLFVELHRNNIALANHWVGKYLYQNKLSSYLILTTYLITKLETKRIQDVIKS